jgi:hypothetical protein
LYLFFYIADSTFIPLVLILIASWNSEEKRKKFFIEFAQRNGFDPYNPENWYSQPIKNVMLAKVDTSLLLFLIFNLILGSKWSFELLFQHTSCFASVIS